MHEALGAGDTQHNQNKTPKSSKDKRSQSDFLHIYDEEAEGDFKEAVRIFWDALLYKPFELLSNERRARVDEAEKLFGKRGNNLLTKRKKLRLSKDDQKFDATMVNPADHSAFLSSK